MKYVFKSQTDQNVMLHQFVDWTHVGSETHQISESKTITTDKGF